MSTLSCVGVGGWRSGIALALSLLGCTKERSGDAAAPNSAEECILTLRNLLPYLGEGPEDSVPARTLDRLIVRCHARAKGSAEDGFFRCAAAARGMDATGKCLRDAPESIVALLSPPPPSDAASADPGSDASVRLAEAERQLEQLRRNTRAAFSVDAAYPAVSAPLTPPRPCCEQPGGTCAPEPRLWETPAWQAVDFRLEQPHAFQYSYTGTATTFTATAVGTPGCDGPPITLVLTGSVENGHPISKLTVR